MFVWLFHCNGNEKDLYLPDKNYNCLKEFQMDRF